MNRDEIMNMKPGRELDALVSAYAFGKSDVKNVADYWFIDGNIKKMLPFYSTDISAAWEVVEKVQQTLSAKFVLSRDPEGSFPMKWIAHFGAYEWETPRIVRDNPAEAICKAALLSLIQEDTP